MLLIKNSYEWWFLVDFLLPPQELFYYIINDNLQQELCLIYEHIMSQSKKGLILGTHAIASELSEITTGREDANFADTNGKYKFFTCSSETLKCNHYAFNSSSILIAGNGEFSEQVSL